jgi:hypothetical protein
MAISRRLAIVVPIRLDAHDEVRRLLEAGPRPFDPEEAPELDRCEAFLTKEEAILIFESEQGANALRQAGAPWEELVAGPPRIAVAVYSWERPEEAGLSFLPTPGPGDSDGGDIF